MLRQVGWRYLDCVSGASSLLLKGSGQGRRPAARPAFRTSKARALLSRLLLGVTTAEHDGQSALLARLHLGVITSMDLRPVAVSALRSGLRRLPVVGSVLCGLGARSDLHALQRHLVSTVVGLLDSYALQWLAVPCSDTQCPATAPCPAEVRGFAAASSSVAARNLLQWPRTLQWHATPGSITACSVL